MREWASVSVSVSPSLWVMPGSERKTGKMSGWCCEEKQQRRSKVENKRWMTCSRQSGLPAG